MTQKTIIEQAYTNVRNTDTPWTVEKYMKEAMRLFSKLVFVEVLTEDKVKQRQKFRDILKREGFE